MFASRATLPLHARALAEQSRSSPRERFFDGAVRLEQRRMSWNGISAAYMNTEWTEPDTSNELLTDRHVMFMGVGGKAHEACVEVDGLPRWRGMKGEGTSSFFAAGRRMRSQHAPGSSRVVVLFFEQKCVETLLHEGKALTWQTRPSTDEAFIAANAAHLADALRGDHNDLAALRAETIATSLHLYCAQRFSNLGSQCLLSGNAVERAIDLIHASFPKAVSLEALAEAAGLSRRQLLTDFRGRTNTTPHQYILRERLSRAQFLLATTTKALSEIARDVGCASPEHLGRMFRQQFGMSPRAWKARNRR